MFLTRRELNYNLYDERLQTINEYSDTSWGKRYLVIIHSHKLILDILSSSLTSCEAVIESDPKKNLRW